MQSLFTVSESNSTVVAPAKPSERCRTLIFQRKIKVSHFLRFLGGNGAYQKAPETVGFYDTDCGIIHSGRLLVSRPSLLFGSVA